MSCTPTKSSNACLGIVIGACISIPIYGALAWIVSRVAHIGYGAALAGTLVVATVTGGLIALWGIKRAKEQP